jgi:transposase
MLRSLRLIWQKVSSKLPLQMLIGASRSAAGCLAPSFFGFFMQLEPCQVVMEACGSAHYRARRISALGHTVRLLPAHYVKAYVRRNKTDRADAAALLEAARCADIRSALQSRSA